MVDDQVSVEPLPLVTVLGLALKLTVGVGPVTETVAACTALPPEPVQDSEYVELVVNAPVACEPLRALLPDQAPEPVHALALVDDQVSVELELLATVLGVAVMLTVGCGAVTDTVAVCEALPPLPVQVIT